jgi:hypothetical protein
MTRFPFGSEEVGRSDPELDRIAAELEGYADETRATPPASLASRILTAVDAEPEPRPGAWSHFTAALVALRRPAQAVAAVAILAAAVVGALALAEIAERARTDGFGSSTSPLPSPTITMVPTVTPSATPTPSVTASPTTSATATPAATVTPRPTLTPAAVETPDASDDHETPEASASDDHGGHGDSGGSSDD